MNKKFLYSLAITVTSIIIVSIVTMSLLYFQPFTANAKSVESDSSLNEEAVVNNVTVPTNIYASHVEYPLVQAVSGIKIEVTGTATEEGYFTADVCYDFPSQKTDYSFTLGGQTPKSITLTTANETIFMYGWKIISGYHPDPNGNFQGNCARLYFPVSPVTDLDNLTLTILRMSTPVPDIPDCDKAQKKLDAAQKNIKVNCENGGYSVSEKPEDMDDQEAREIALDAFIDIVEGPWIFKLK